MQTIIYRMDKQQGPGTSPAVQWLRLCASSAGDVGLIPGRGTNIPHAAKCSQKKKKNLKKLKKQTNKNNNNKKNKVLGTSLVVQ